MKKRRILTAATAAVLAALLLNGCAMPWMRSADGEAETEASEAGIQTSAEGADTPSSPTEPTAEPSEPAPSVPADPSPAPSPPPSDTPPASEPVPPTQTTPEPTPPPAEDPGGAIHVREIRLDKNIVAVKIGDSDMPLVTMLPENAWDKGEIWTSSDPAVASVNSYGKITGTGVGTCTVTVQSYDNRDVIAEVSVTVVEEGPIHVQAISLDKYETFIRVGLMDMPWVTMLPTTAENKGEIWTSGDTGIATVDQYGRIKGIAPGTCTVTCRSQDNQDVTARITVNVSESPVITDPTYMNGILVVNKSYGLPRTYNPGVSTDTQAALDAMFDGAAEDGIKLWVESGFRSYDQQLTLYNTYVSREGQTEADRYSARPGYSEHQTGLCFDLNSFELSFDQTPEGIWLVNHAWEYGFILRFPKDKEDVTGFMYEPWHVRYVGKDVAKTLHENGQTLEEYLGITSVYATP